MTTQPLWDWYTAQITEVPGLSPRVFAIRSGHWPVLQAPRYWRAPGPAALGADPPQVLTPVDNVKFLISYANGRWGKAIRSMIVGSLFDEKRHASIGLLTAAPHQDARADGPHQDSIAERTLMIEWHLLYRRSWSFLVHDCPPFTYAPYAASSTARTAEASALLKRDWSVLLRLEAITSPSAKFLRKELTHADSEPFRTLALFFERDCFAASSVCGQNHLRGLLQSPPDNKVVEDVQKDLRNDARFNMCRKMTFDHMQDVVARSKVRGGPEVSCPPAVPHHIAAGQRPPPREANS